MKTLRLLAFAVGITAAFGTPASAQSSLPKADAAAFISWQAAEAQQSHGFEGDAWSHSLFGGASAGFYWTEHLKTELDAGASASTISYQPRRVVVGSTVLFQTSVVEASRRTLGISQQFQFYENSWFHPHVAAGASVTWERRTEHVQPAFVLDPATGRPVTDLVDQLTDATHLTVRPFIAAGFKAYMSPRWFFRADSRLAFRRGLEETHVRLGVGRDW